MSRRVIATVMASFVALACSAEIAPGQPPPGLTPAGQALWEFEALLHDTFHDFPVSAHYDQGRDWKFAACGRVGCAPLSYWSIYFFTFKNARRSSFHLSARRALPSFGNYPIPIRVKGRYVACNHAESRFLIRTAARLGSDSRACQLTANAATGARKHACARVLSLGANATCRRAGVAELPNRRFSAAYTAERHARGQKLGKSLQRPCRPQREKPRISRAFSVAGAGFEPATSGL